MKKQAKHTRHLESLELPDGFTDEILINWYQAYQPVGSGPITMGRALCALIEEIAKSRNIELPPARGVK